MKDNKKKPTIHLIQGPRSTYCGRPLSNVVATEDRSKVTCKTCKAARAKRIIFYTRG